MFRPVSSDEKPGRLTNSNEKLLRNSLAFSQAINCQALLFFIHSTFLIDR
jgi:hypothetical protein